MEKVCMGIRVRMLFPCFLMILLIGTLAPLYLSAEVVDKVVAVVNDEVITLSELNAETAELTRAIVKKHPDQPVAVVVEKARDMAMDSMIERRLIKQKATKYNVSVTNEDVEAAYQKMRSGLGLDPGDGSGRRRRAPDDMGRVQRGLRQGGRDRQDLSVSHERRLDRRDDFRGRGLRHGHRPLPQGLHGGRSRSDAEPRDDRGVRADAPDGRQLHG